MECEINDDCQSVWMYYKTTPGGSAMHQYTLDVNTYKEIFIVSSIRFLTYCYTMDCKEDGWYTFTRNNWDYSALKTKTTVEDIHGEFLYRYKFTDIHDGKITTTDWIYRNVE